MKYNVKKNDKYAWVYVICNETWIYHVQNLMSYISLKKILSDSVPYIIALARRHLNSFLSHKL